MLEKLTRSLSQSAGANGHIVFEADAGKRVAGLVVWANLIHTRLVSVPPSTSGKTITLTESHHCDEERRF